MGPCAVFFTVLLSILFPPFSVFIVAGCGADVLINIVLTALGYFPGHIHAIYIRYVFYRRKKDRENGIALGAKARGIFSERVQSGGSPEYGTTTV